MGIRRRIRDNVFLRYAAASHAQQIPDGEQLNAVQSVQLALKNRKFSAKVPHSDSFERNTPTCVQGCEALCIFLQFDAQSPNE